MLELMCKRLSKLIGASISAALLAACGGGDNGLSTSRPFDPSLAAPAGGLPAITPWTAGVRSVRSHLGNNYRVLYRFAGGADGSHPLAFLTNVGGTLYGTTQNGGSGCPGSSDGCGTVFKIAPSGKESVLHSFGHGTDGGFPSAALTSVDGTLYGTTVFGGAKTFGTVFKITTSGTESVLHSFGGGSNGAEPSAGLTNVGGTLYGTTSAGGASGWGTVFKITVFGRETVLHSFGRGGTDGVLPYAGLTNLGGTLYGTTASGGGSGCYSHSGCGTVFKITTSGTETVLYCFAGGLDGYYPYARLLNVGGNLYGTTSRGGGPSGGGTVFKITASGKETVLYRFARPPGDGANSYGGLINVGGILYGTTENGGASGLGTIFNITTDGRETVLHSFPSPPDGAYPYAGLTNVGGTLYGSTEIGGGSGCQSGGCGTVFALTP